MTLSRYHFTVFHLLQQNRVYSCSRRGEKMKPNLWDKLKLSLVTFSLPHDGKERS